MNIETSNMLKKYDLVETTFDSYNGAFSEPIRINNSDNENFEFSPVVYGNNGEFTVSWLENEDNNVYQQSGNNKIFKASYDEYGNAISYKNILTTSNTISKIEISQSGLYYSVQNESNNSLYVYNDSINVICENIDDFSCTFDSIYYLSDGALYKCNSNGTVKYNDGWGYLNNIKVVNNGNDTSLFTAVLNKDFSKTIYFSELLDDNSWTHLEAYSNDYFYIRNYSPVILSNGESYIAYNNIDLTSNTEYQKTTLCVDGKVDYVDLQLNYIDFDNEQLKSDKLSIKCEIQNNSSVPLSAIDYFIFNADGSELLKGTLDCFCDSFSNCEQYIDFVIPENYSGERISIKVLPNGIMDNFEENNSMETTFECAHNYVERGEPSTCVSDGYLVCECKYCGESKKEILPAYGHDYEISISDNEINYFCPSCFDSYSIDATQYFNSINNAKIIINDYYEFYREDGFNQLLETFNEYDGLENSVVTQNDLDNAATNIQGKIDSLEFVESYTGTGLNGEIWIWSAENNSITFSGDVSIADYISSNVPWFAFRNVATTIVISDGITGIGSYAFHAFSAIKQVDIANTVTKIGRYAFYGDLSLQSVILPNTITSIDDYAFSNCSALANIDLGDSIITIGKYAFEKNWSLTSIIIPDSTTIIDYAAFEYCTSLKNVTVPASVQYGGYAFSNDTAISNIKVTKGIDGIMPDCSTVIMSILFKNRKGAFAPWRYANDAQIELEEGITRIGLNTFYGANCIRNITIPESVISIGDKAFYSCKNLQELTIPKNVESIGFGITSYCTNLSSIEVEEENNYFDSRNNCNAIMSKLNNSLLAGCSETVIPENTKTIGSYAFYNISGIKDVSIPDSVDTIGTYAFYHCTGLSSIVIPNEVTSVEPYAFSGCSEILNVVLNDNITVIGKYAFSDNGKLTKISIPEKVTEIGDGAFSGSGIVTAVIPVSVKTIGNYALNCESLTDIYYTGSSTQWSEIAIGTNNTPLENATKHYNCVYAHPASSHKYYKENIVEATCLEQGYTIFTCSLCQDSYTEFYVATGHDYGECIGQNYIHKISGSTISSTPDYYNEFYHTSTSIGSKSTVSTTSTNMAVPNEIRLDINNINDVKNYQFGIKGGLLLRKNCSGIFAYDKNTGRQPEQSAIPYTDNDGNLVNMKYVDYKIDGEWVNGEYTIDGDNIIDVSGTVVSTEFTDTRPHIVYTRNEAITNGVLNDDGTVNVSLETVEGLSVSFSAGIPGVYFTPTHITSSNSRKFIDVFGYDENADSSIETGKYDIDICFYNTSNSGLASTTFKIYDNSILQKQTGENEYELTCIDCGEKHTETVDKSALIAAQDKFAEFSSEDYSTKSFEKLQKVCESYKYIENSYASQEKCDAAVTEILEAIYDLEPYLNFTVSAENGSYEVTCDESTTSNNKYSLLFGTEITLSATANEGYEFVGWYDVTNNLYFSTNSTYTFKLTENTNLKAVFVKEQSATLTFTTYSNWVQSTVTKTIDEWNNVTSIEDLLPQVPYKYGYSNGRWVYDNDEVLAKLRAGESVFLIPEYDEDDMSLPTPREPENGVPALDLYYKLDADANVGSFVMAAGIPDDCQIESVGVAFYYKKANEFDPTKFELLINNKMLVSRFNTKEIEDIYIVNMNKLTSTYNWAVRGYVTYYDADGNLKTAYSNQVNIVNREQV